MKAIKRAEHDIDQDKRDDWSCVGGTANLQKAGEANAAARFELSGFKVF